MAIRKASLAGGAWTVALESTALPTGLEADGWSVQARRLQGWTAYASVVSLAGCDVRVLVADPSAWEYAGDEITAKVMLMIGAETLWRYASRGMGCGDAARQVIRQTAELWAASPSESEWEPGRLDVCVDTWDARPWTLRHWINETHGIDDDNICGWEHGDVRALVTRARSTAAKRSQIYNEESDCWEFVGSKATTVYLGRRGGNRRFARFYNKTIEMEQKGKGGWLRPAWRACGWDGEAIVWRIEIEHGGAWLRSWGIKGLSDLDGIEAKLWAKWCKENREVPPDDGDGNRWRRKLTPRWQAIKAAAGKPAPWRWERTAPNRQADRAHLRQMISGCAATLLADYLHLPDPMAALMEDLGADMRDQFLAAAARRRSEGDERKADLVAAGALAGIPDGIAVALNGRLPRSPG